MDDTRGRRLAAVHDALRRGAHADAVRAAGVLLAVDPADVEPLRLRASARLALGDRDAAIADVRALAAAARDPSTWVEAARLGCRLDLGREAEAWADRAVAAGASVGDVLRMLAAAGGWVGEATALWEASVHDDADRARLIAHLARAGDHAGVLVHTSGSDAPARVRARVDALLALGRDADAVAALAGLPPEAQDVPRWLGAGAVEGARRVAASAPDGAAWRVRLALWSRDVAGAEAGLSSVGPGEVPGLRASIARVRGDLHAVVRHAAGAPPEDVEARVLRAEALRRLGRAEEAGALVRAPWPRGVSPTLGHDVNGLLLVYAPGWPPAPDPNLAGTLDTLASVVDVPAAWRTSGPDDLPALRALLETALDRMSGNRSAVPTWCDGDGGVHPIRRAASARAEAAALRALLPVRGFDAAIAAHDALLARHRDVPLVWTYRGELFLWRGEVEAARRDFQAALDREATTRWAWIGLGATHLLAGDPATAVAVFDHSVTVLPPGRTLWAYRAEACWRLGDLDGARADLRRALELAPQRPSAHLLAAALADPAHAGGHLARVAQVAPAFARDLAWETGVDLRGHVAPAEVRPVAEHGLAMLRGNRAASQLTWFTSDGRARAAAVGGHDG